MPQAGALDAYRGAFAGTAPKVCLADQHGTILRMPVARRSVLGASLVAATATLAGCARQKTSWTAAPGGGGPLAGGADGAGLAPSGEATASGSALPEGFGRAPQPRANTPAELVFTPGRTIKTSPREANYGGTLNRVMTRYLAPTSDNPNYPSFAGGVVLVTVDGVGA